jgi:hypothetical protein
VLPDSTAPGVEEFRDTVRLALREALLTEASVDVLLAYADTVDGQQDAEVLRLALEMLPVRSPRRAALVTRLESSRREGDVAAVGGTRSRAWQDGGTEVDMTADIPTPGTTAEVPGRRSCVSPTCTASRRSTGRSSVSASTCPHPRSEPC